MNNEPRKRVWLKDSLALLFTVGMICLATVFVLRSDKAIIERNKGVRVVPESENQGTATVSDEERNVANVFASDTLPKLIQRGIIKKVERHGAATVISVAGLLWSKRSPFFKESLLKAFLAYHRANDLPLWTRIVDDRTGKLYAEVLPSAQFEVYD